VALDVAPEDVKTRHNKKSYPALAIDPSTLSEIQRNKYIDNEVLKRRRVFVKGGMSLQEAANQMEVPNPDRLLKILSETPTKEMAAKNALDLKRETIIEDVEKAVDYNETAIIKAYNDSTANHLAELKYLKDKEWPAMKSGIKRVALPLPKIQNLRNKATNIVNRTVFKTLNAKFYERGEAISDRKAVDAVLKNDIPLAFIHKENAALNSELARASRIGIAQGNKAVKRIGKLNNSHARAVLKRAGSLYENAALELMVLFNFTPMPEDVQIKYGAYQKYTEQMKKEKKGDLALPQNFVDPKTALSLEQLLELDRALYGIYKQAQ
jgi:hypothetical protein